MTEISHGRRVAARSGKAAIWTQERLDLLASWLVEGESYGGIAARLTGALGGPPVSRDAVASACRYYGLRPGFRGGKTPTTGASTDKLAAEAMADKLGIAGAAGGGLRFGVHCQFIPGRPSADDGCKCGAPVHKPGAAYCA